jgi:hypothetical protein
MSYTRTILPATSDPVTLAQVLKDLAEIEALVRLYADICDEQYDPDKLVELFTDDATWASSSQSGTSDFGVHQGREAIYEFFAGVSAQIVFAHHIVMSPEIDVYEPGVRARGRWNTVVLMHLVDDPLSQDDERKMIASVYQHEYVNTVNGWKIADLKVHTRFDLRVRAVG